MRSLHAGRVWHDRARQGRYLPLQVCKVDLRDVLEKLDDNKVVFLLSTPLDLGSGDGGVVRLTHEESALHKCDPRQAPKVSREKELKKLVGNLARLVRSPEAVDLREREGEVWAGIAGNLDNAKADLIRKYHIPHGPRIVSIGPGGRRAREAHSGAPEPATPELGTPRALPDSPASNQSVGKGTARLSSSHEGDAPSVEVNMPLVAASAVASIHASLRTLRDIVVGAAARRAVDRDTAAVESRRLAAQHKLRAIVRLCHR